MDEKQTNIKTTFEMWGRDDQHSHEETVSVLPFGKFRENRKNRWRKRGENMWNIFSFAILFRSGFTLKGFTGR